MSKYTFIINPAAGNGSGRRLKSAIENSIRSRTDDFEVVETSGPRDATTIARNTPSAIVVAIGGDGTINEVANGIVGSRKILGVIPIGSGNDLIKSVGIPRGLDDALSCLFKGSNRQIDVGTLRTGDANHLLTTDCSYFINGLGVGFDAMVAARTRSITYASGTLRYVISVLQTLRTFKCNMLSVEIDGRTTELRRLLMAVGNGVCAGGGFFLTPKAKVDDGLLDICLIDEISSFGIMRLMPKVMRGKHQGVSSVHFDRGRGITVRSNTAFPVHADGEVVGTDILRLEVGVLPKALTVIAG